MASRSSFSVTGQSAASGNPTKTAIIAVKATVRWIFMEQPSSKAGLYQKAFRLRGRAATAGQVRLRAFAATAGRVGGTGLCPRAPRLRYNSPSSRGLLLGTCAYERLLRF